MNESQKTDESRVQCSALLADFLAAIKIAEANRDDTANRKLYDAAYGWDCYRRGLEDGAAFVRAERISKSANESSSPTAGA